MEGYDIAVATSAVGFEHCLHQRQASSGECGPLSQLARISAEGMAALHQDDPGSSARVTV